MVKVINPENDLLIFGGVIAGFIGGYTYNHFHKVKLPEFLAFFGGRRFVPIMAGVITLFIAMVIGYIWPNISTGIKNLADWITGAGAVGLLFYGIFNRLLIPFGLQHIIEKYAYFALGSYTDSNGTQVIGDLNRFFAGDPTAGMFMSGFFPIMMFGLPAAALAMYLAVPKEKRYTVAGLFISVALTSFLTGVTEPIEFSFLFVAPLLYAIHAVLMGTSFAIAHVVGAKAGFTFSGGIIDLILSWRYSTNGWMILVMGVIFAIIYFVIFYTLIKALNLKTPGRDESITANTQDSSSNSYTEKAEKYIIALGGKDNFEILTNCVTRLRITLKDVSLIDENSLKALGAKGVITLKDSVQVIIGADVEFLADAMKQELPL